MNEIWGLSINITNYHFRNFLWKMAFVPFSTETSKARSTKAVYFPRFIMGNIIKSTTPPPSYNLKKNNKKTTKKQQQQQQQQQKQQKFFFILKIWTLASQNFKKKPPWNPIVHVDQSTRFCMLFSLNMVQKLGCRSLFVVLCYSFVWNSRNCLQNFQSCIYPNFFGGSYYVELYFSFRTLICYAKILQSKKNYINNK